MTPASRTSRSPDDIVRGIVCPADQAAFLTGRSFFPQLISGPSADGLATAFWFAIVACLVAAVGAPHPSGSGREWKTGL